MDKDGDHVSKLSYYLSIFMNSGIDNLDPPRLKLPIFYSKTKLVRKSLLDTTSTAPEALLEVLNAHIYYLVREDMGF